MRQTLFGNSQLVSFWSCLVMVSFLHARAEARVTGIQITSREVVAAGMPFANAGPYEKLKGTVSFRVNRDDPHNSGVFDIDKAPQSPDGFVEFSADFFILKPVDLKKGNGALFYEVPNQGLKRAFILFHDVDGLANVDDPRSVGDFGNAFLLKQGYALAWVGWQPGIAPVNGHLGATLPIAVENGRPISERVVVEFADGDSTGGVPYTQRLRFSSISTDPFLAQAELRRRPSDSPRPSGPEIPEGELVPDSDWSFARCSDGPPGLPSDSDICLAGGFRNDMVYEFRYRATSSPVSGLGYLTTRDFISFLRHSASDEIGTSNPVYGISTVLAYGTSLSGQYLRDHLYQGFNEDEEGRRVFDGMHIQAAGVRKVPLNYRFAPAAGSRQHAGRQVPDDTFPWTYGLRHDPLTGEEDGLLRRPSSDPKIISTDTSTEYWIGRASLVDTNEDGTEDLDQPDNVRRYLFSSAQHSVIKGNPASLGIANRQCQQYSNTNHVGALARALFVALDAWVRTGHEPPASRIPTIKDGTLVSPDQESTGFPSIPDVVYNGLYNASGIRDFGPRVVHSSGVIDYLNPVVLRSTTVLVPSVDSAGNDVAGIRHPFVQAPTATLTGWNLRQPEFTDGDLCDLNGMSIDLPKTKADRIATGDPRPSLEELYGSHTGYVLKVAEAALNLWSQRLMLLDDVFQTIQEADERPVLK